VEGRDKPLKLKQLIAFIISISCMVAIITLTGAAVNKHLTLGWYVFWMALSTLVLQLDICYLDKQINGGEWR
jgi:hypothetical protein